MLDGGAESSDRVFGFDGGYFAVGDGFRREGDGLVGEADGGVEAVEVDEVPHVIPEGLRAPVDVVVGGLATGEVVGGEVVVDEAGDDGLVGGDGLREQAAAEGKHGDIAFAGGAFGEEDDGEAVAEAFGHAFCGFGGGATGAAGDVDGAGHEADPAEDGGLAELDLGDEDAGTERAVEEDVDVGEVVGDDGAVGGDGADGGEGDLLRAEKAVADAAEPGGAFGAGFGAEDDDFNGGVSEGESDGKDAVEPAKEGQDVRFLWNDILLLNRGQVYLMGPV